MARFALFRKKERWTATWLGNLIKLGIFLLLVVIWAHTIQPFLAPIEIVESDLLVVEGFIPDYAIEEAGEIYKAGKYRQMIITGKKRMKGAHLDQYENDGAFSAATLIKLGFDSAKIVVVAVDRDIKRDRTYVSALAIKQWIEENQIKETGFNIVTLGCHARRSRLLFEKAFGDQYNIGIIAIDDRGYDADHWWQSSNGFREVIKETIAWVYARFFFWPN